MSEYSEDETKLDNKLLIAIAVIVFLLILIPSCCSSSRTSKIKRY
jgi:hypothetical protein